MVLKSNESGGQVLDWRAVMIVVAATTMGGGAGSYIERQSQPQAMSRADFELALFQLEARIRQDMPPVPYRRRIDAIEEWIRHKDPSWRPPPDYNGAQF